MDRRFSALALVVLTTAACTAPRELPPATTAVPSTTTIPLTPEEAVSVFHSCLTDQGLIVPEISLDEKGRPDLSALADATRQDPNEWQEALTSCAAVVVANGALDLSAEPELAEAVRGRLLAFSACMRSNGVDDFPDPPPGFDGTAPPFPISTIPVTDPELAAAAEACASIVE